MALSIDIARIQFDDYDAAVQSLLGGTLGFINMFGIIACAYY